MKHMWRSLSISVCLLASLALAAGPALAQSQEEKAAAEHAFDQGRRLMSQGRYQEACEKFARSQALEPSVGALLNEANCREKLGQIATAWSLYREAEREARKRGDRKRVRLARKRASKLAPSLSYLTINVPDPSQVAGLVISCNGQPMASAAWNQPVPTDPGEYEIKAEAPNRQTWSTKTGVGASGENAIVEVPRLPLSAHGQVLKPPGVEEPGETEQAQQPLADPVEVEKGGEAETETETEPGPSIWTPRRKLALVTASAGAAAVIASGVFALRSRRAKSRAKDHCDDGFQICTVEGTNALDDAHMWRDISTITLVAGAAAVATGAFLWFGSSDPEGESSAQTAQVLPAVSPTGGFVSLRGRF